MITFSLLFLQQNRGDWNSITATETHRDSSNGHSTQSQKAQRPLKAAVHRLEWLDTVARSNTCAAIFRLRTGHSRPLQHLCRHLQS